MKRLTKLCAMVLAFALLIPIQVFASVERNSSTEIVYMDDGSYYVITIEESPTRTTYSKTSAKHYTYYSSENVAQWKVTLTGTYTYNGATSSCTAASASATVYKSSWSVASKSATHSGNQATGNYVIKLALLLGQSTNVPVTLTMSCDKNGNLT